MFANMQTCKLLPTSLSLSNFCKDSIAIEFGSHKDPASVVLL